MSAADHDAVVIGAGHNGLACACYLAKAGMRVVVVEAYEAVGGMTLTEELTLPGFWSDVHASGYQLANFSPAPPELELARHGLVLIEPGVVYAHAFADGRAVAVLSTGCRKVRRQHRPVLAAGTPRRGGHSAPATRRSGRA